jgi:hypothetical protein
MTYSQPSLQATFPQYQKTTKITKITKHSSKRFLDYWLLSTLSSMQLQYTGTQNHMENADPVSE